MIAHQPRHHQCIFKQTTHHASHLQQRMQLAETQTTRGMCIPVHSPPVTRKHRPRHALSTHSLGDEPPAVVAAVTISALGRNSQSEKLKVQNSNKTENQQLRIRDPPPKPKHDHERSPYRCTSTRFCSAFGRSTLSSFRSTAGV